MILGLRVIGILEGISYILLVFFAMPLKYWAAYGAPNKVVGMAHGILFILYVVLAAMVCWEQKWGIKRFLILFVASLLPFGTFWTDKEYLSQAKVVRS